MKILQDFNVENKRVLVRCDFDVPLDEEGNILDDFRIEKSIPTIEYLIKKGAKVILMAHLGRPGGAVKKELSLALVQEMILEYLDISVIKADDCVGEKIEQWTYKMQAGEVLLLENLRFHKEEKENNKEFAGQLAGLADIYINDNFSASHRRHASFVGVPKFLPSGAGLLFQQELEALDKILKNPKKPVAAIIGGVKVESKIKPINEFLEKGYFVLLGGKIANAVLRAKEISVGKPLPDREVLEEISAFELTNPKLKLPVDSLVALDSIYVRQSGIGADRKDEQIFDIGPETVKLFSAIIAEAKTIFWAGPMGRIEDERFGKGTLGVARAIINSRAFSLVGGGDTVSFIRKQNLENKFSYVSTAGGAMLEYLSKGTLPGIEALQ